MKVLIASDTFKGSLFSAEAAEAIHIGIFRFISSAEIKVIPFADGSECTIEDQVTMLDSAFWKFSVAGPHSQAVAACYKIINSGKIAVIEMSEAAGITLVPKDKLDPLHITA